MVNIETVLLMLSIAQLSHAENAKEKGLTCDLSVREGMPNKRPEVVDHFRLFMLMGVVYSCHHLS